MAARKGRPRGTELSPPDPAEPGSGAQPSTGPRTDGAASAHREAGFVRLLALVLAALLASGGCASSQPSAEPEDEEPERKEVLLETVYHDEVAGRDASEEVAAQLGLVANAELTAYVNAIGQRLVKHAPGHPFDYVFHIVDQDAPNAFALPGGFIYVSRGLLQLANSEDELANVIGHEIGHVAERHAAARQQVQGSGLFAWLRMIHVAGYGRDQERSADRVGQKIAASAGYDPAGMADFLRDLEFTERLRLGASRLPSFLDTHPLTNQRVIEARQRAQLISFTPEPGIVPSRDAYLRKLDGLPVGIPAAEGVFQGERFLHPDMDFTLRFPDGWETHNTRSAVGAISPQRNAQIFLEASGPETDTQAAASRWIEKAVLEGFKIRRTQAVKIGDAEGFRITGRVSTGRGPMHAVVTWISHGGTVFRLTGLASTGISKKYQGVFVSVARGFRPLTPAMRASIVETRLRVVPALGGESLTTFGEQHRNEWGAQRTAVMNDLSASEPLGEGQLVKIAVEELYESSS